MQAEIKLSANQKKFVKSAEKAGLDVDYSYSGRFMYGKTCPAVRVSYLEQWPGNPNKYSIDNMGKGYVIYARS